MSNLLPNSKHSPLIVPFFIGACCIVAASCSSTEPIRADEPTAKPVAIDRPESHLLEPFWASAMMYGEGLLFVQPTDAERPFARLAFVPTGGVSLQSASGAISFVEGQDYLVEAKTRTITLHVGSKIPFVTEAALAPPPGIPNSMGGHIDGRSNFLWSEGHFFHDMQVEATYPHGKNQRQGYTPIVASTNLRKTLGLLKRKEPLHIVTLGDSISQGYNASGYVNVAPMMPSYSELVRSHLQSFYGSQVSLTNLAIAGKTPSVA